MIASLTGKIQHIASDRCVLDVNGVGYEVFLSTEGLSRLPERGEEVFLHIHTNVREDAFILFGFDSRAEKEMFLTLKTVSGIGPKLGLAILSGMQVDALCQAILMEDIKGLTTISGVGKKTAERLCMELKDKVGSLQTATSEALQSTAVTLTGGTVLVDALSALVNLGYLDAVAREALAKVKKQMGDDVFAQMKVEELIREGLRTLA
ncbi:MAG: Holliday junction branch migration protein RuvA [Thermodesulfobacteriota bacterium]|nr:Holliday junction branch migration protein RuvA [Thermodesulfobacteriota bacterium]